MIQNRPIQAGWTSHQWRHAHWALALLSYGREPSLSLATHMDNVRVLVFQNIYAVIATTSKPIAQSPTQHKVAKRLEGNLKLSTSIGLCMSDQLTCANDTKQLGPHNHYCGDLRNDAAWISERHILWVGPRLDLYSGWPGLSASYSLNWQLNCVHSDVFFWSFDDGPPCRRILDCIVDTLFTAENMKHGKGDSILAKHGAEVACTFDNQRDLHVEK